MQCMDMTDVRYCASDNSSIHHKVAIIREEFVKLTGHPYQAILLNQLFFWSQTSRNKEGWIYKSAIDFVEETMIKVSKWTFYRRMKTLIENDWVESKDNSRCRWDKTTSYRLNIEKIKIDLQKIGFSLPNIFREILLKPAEMSKLQPAPSMEHSATSKLQPAPSKNKETDKKIYKKDVNYKKKGLPKKCQKDSSDHDLKILDEVGILEGKSIKNEGSLTDIWKKYHPDDVGDIQESELSKIAHFSNESQWEEFCKLVKYTPYLQGDNSKGWKISLSWLMSGENLDKVLKSFKPQDYETRLYEEANSHINSISDPMMKDLCREILNKYSPTLHYRNEKNIIEDLKIFINSEIWKYKVGSFDNEKKKLLLLIPKGRYFVSTGEHYPYQRFIRSYFSDLMLIEDAYKT